MAPLIDGKKDAGESHFKKGNLDRRSSDLSHLKDYVPIRNGCFNSNAATQNSSRLEEEANQFGLKRTIPYYY